MKAQKLSKKKTFNLIFSSLDGDTDCANGRDEENCTTTSSTPVAPEPIPTCHDWMFRCKNERCVPHWWKCDSINDCGDMSDEIGCVNTTSPISTTTTTEQTSTSDPEQECNSNQFACDTEKICLGKAYVCDGYKDCPNGEDENNCPPDLCGRGKFRCRSDGVCLDITKYCDGIINCVDASDEEDCHHVNVETDNATIICQAGFFMCDHTCAPLAKLCNGKQDCYDYDDEKNCSDPNNRHFQLSHVLLHKKTLNATSFLIFWYEPTVFTGAQKNDTNKYVFEYLPKISSNNIDWEQDSWIENTEFRFNNLKPFTTYNVTVIVRPKNASRVDPPFLYLNVTTGEGLPSEPQNVRVTQLNGTRVQVSWEPPKDSNGLLKEYTVYYRAQTYSVQQAHSVKVSPQETSIVLESNFEPNVTYEFWVRARNSKNESLNSKLVRLTFDKASDMDRLSGLRIVRMDKNHVELEWAIIKDVDGYIIQVVLPQNYSRLPSFRTAQTKYIVEHLPKGVELTIKVGGYKKNYVGRMASVTTRLNGAPLPEVKAEIEKKGNDYTIKWEPVDMPGVEVLYGVYCGQTLDELLDSKRKHLFFH